MLVKRAARLAKTNEQKVFITIQIIIHWHVYPLPGKFQKHRDELSHVNFRVFIFK